MFFASAGGDRSADKYRLLLDASRFADQHGFSSIWTPERHFHEFGGLFPSPAVLSAALAVATARIQIRAGSLISPLHQAIRIAEEWSIVDNLSGGRVAVSFGSGWNVDDFLFFPERYAARHAVMYEQIETVRRLWRGEAMAMENSYGKPAAVKIYPRPVQPELPIWITSSGNVETFASAGARGANVLTHLLGQGIGDLAAKVARYRRAWAEAHGGEAGGKVTLMLHTFVGRDTEAVRRKVRAPFREYLRSAISLEQLAAESGGVISGGHRIDPQQAPAALLEELLDLSFERYFRTGALMGTPADCARLVTQLAEIGVDEIACLIDFGLPTDTVLRGLDPLDELRRLAQGLKPRAEVAP